MNNTTEQNSQSSQTEAEDEQLDDEVDMLFGADDSKKRGWRKKYADKYGNQTINELPGGNTEFLVDLPVEFIENKLMQKWGIGPGSKLIVR